MRLFEWFEETAGLAMHRLLPSFLEIVDDGPNRLELKSNRGRFIFDARRRVISRNGKQIATFRQIKFVDLTREKETLEFTEWRVALYINFFHRIRIGECRDDVRVSIIGARIVTLTGAKPLAWKESHGLRR